jgi:hypothetical protein
MTMTWPDDVMISIILTIIEILLALYLSWISLKLSRESDRAILELRSISELIKSGLDNINNQLLPIINKLLERGHPDVQTQEDKRTIEELQRLRQRLFEGEIGSGGKLQPASPTGSEEEEDAA